MEPFLFLANDRFCVIRALAKNLKILRRCTSQDDMNKYGGSRPPRHGVLTMARVSGRRWRN